MKKFICSLLIIHFANTMISQTNDKRIALIIGNNSYSNAPLKNPVNDANLMATTLQGLGFTVIKKVNANRVQMAQAIADFWSKLSNYDVALFFFAGHGVQVNGVNYLIPVDATMNTQDMVSFEAISVNEVVSKFEEYPQNTNIVILDACRNNPFRSWARGGASGFKAMNPGSGTIIAFATSEGATASDGEGNNGLFTEKLVKHISKPIPIETVFKNTRVDVQKASGGNQSPQEWTKLTGEFFFVKSKIQVNTETTDNEMTKYGNISIDSETRGFLYIDGNKIGFLASKSKGNIFKDIPVGKHSIVLEGEDKKTGEIYVAEGKTTNFSFDNLNSVLYDRRNNKTYSYAKIGDQVWMTQNMALKLEKGCWVYDDDSKNIENYGYLYDWESAKTVCPPGWKLPSKEDVQKLFNYLGNTSEERYNSLVNGKGASFSPSFAGFKIPLSGAYMYLNDEEAYWTASSDQNQLVFYFGITNLKLKMAIEKNRNDCGLSVRCIKIE
ncbi:MAG: caspase family protein [Bacteroidales bacterium]